jgi:hypothetical protein
LRRLWLIMLSPSISLRLFFFRRGIVANVRLWTYWQE